ncbi:hypothetical protein JTB14_031458 [Gonioctena quinquepunctata]|nr:hypothetical protein JTB14_031458 [Gonioctena quinquepunctata]
MMLYLVRFGDNTTGIYNAKCLVTRHDETCIIKHRGSKYEAQIIHSSDSRKELEDIQNESLENDPNCDDNGNEIFTHEICHNSTSTGESMIDSSVEDVEVVDHNISEGTEKSDNSAEKLPSCGEKTSESLNNRSNLNTTFVISFDTFAGDMIELTDENISFSYEDLNTSKTGNFINPSADIFSNLQPQLPAPGKHLNPSQNGTFIDSSEDISNWQPRLPAPGGLLPDAATIDDSETFSRTHLTSLVDSLIEETLSTDDSQKDPDYNVRNESQESYHNVDFSDKAPAESSVELVTASPNITGLNPCDDSLLHVEKSCGRNGDKKGNFCIFCHTKHKKIARHFEIRHKNEEDVQKFLSIPKKSSERRKLIAVLRKRGNYLFNSDKNYNDGELIVSRRPNEKHLRAAKDFRACGNCKAYFAKNSLRAHFRKCTKKSSKNERLVMIMSKKVMGRIHSKASKTVREELFPPLREDNIIGGRFLITMRNLNSEVTDLSSIYDPKFIDDTSKAINIEAGLVVETFHYRTPTVAFNLGTLLKQIGNILINECIKNHSNEKKVNTENYIHLLGQEVAIGINRTVAESQFQGHRRKKVELPSKDDIKLLHTHLSNKRREALKCLENGFSLIFWKILSETTLMSLQLFNRRRAGEIERILIDDFRSYHGIDEFSNKDIFQSLSKESRELAKKYVRFVIRGKLNRNVPVLLDKHLLQCLNKILELREEAGVPVKNPYVFGVPSLNKSQHKYLRACNLMRKFSSEWGAENPERLRGTKLRKHIATACITLNLSENDISDLANFMGHRESIHKSFYRQPIVVREILKISKLLEAAQGVNEEDDSDDSNEETHPEMKNCEINPHDIQTEKGSFVASGNISSVTSRKRSTSPFGTVKRTRWSELEKKAVFTQFRSNIRSKKLPSLKEIQNIICVNPILQNRTSAQIKTWIHNQFKEKKNNP